jgi:hypothetical protein
MTDHSSPGNDRLRENVARAIHDALGGNGWAYTNYGGDEWNDKREELLGAATAAMELLLPAQSKQDRDETLRGLAEFFSESVHLVWSSDEIADCLTDMISDAPAVPSTERRPLCSLCGLEDGACICHAISPASSKIGDGK